MPFSMLSLMVSKTSHYSVSDECITLWQTPLSGSAISVSVWQSEWKKNTIANPPDSQPCVHVVYIVCRQSGQWLHSASLLFVWDGAGELGDWKIYRWALRALYIVLTRDTIGKSLELYSIIALYSLEQFPDTSISFVFIALKLCLFTYIISIEGIPILIKWRCQTFSELW